MNESLWYNQLSKPWFAPPSWLFGPVWSVLYVLIAIAVVLSIKELLQKSVPQRLYVVIALNLTSNVAFTPLQFGLQNNLLALIDILIVLTTTWWWIYITRTKTLITWLLLPYALWVSFATVLQISITVLNF